MEVGRGGRAPVRSQLHSSASLAMLRSTGSGKLPSQLQFSPGAHRLRSGGRRGEMLAPTSTSSGCQQPSAMAASPPWCPSPCLLHSPRTDVVPLLPPASSQPPGLGSCQATLCWRPPPPCVPPAPGGSGFLPLLISGLPHPPLLPSLLFFSSFITCKTNSLYEIPSPVVWVLFACLSRTAAPGSAEQHGSRQGQHFSC